MKLNKLLSSVLAASMVVSCCAINAFAASKAHNATLTAVEADGVVTVEVTMDNTEALCAVEYELTYDATAFTADTTKVSRLEKCIDKTWLDGMKDTDGDWGYYLGNPVYNVANPGVMAFKWAGSSGVEAEYAMDNRVIGKFYLNVVEGTNGTFTFNFTGKTTDIGENSNAAFICDPVTITIGTVVEEEKTVWTNADDASIPADKQIIADVANVTGVTNATRVTVSNGSETKTFGNNIFAYLRANGVEIADDATADGEFRFAILAPADADPAAFTFSVNN